MSATPFFKCFPSDFLNGIADMGPNEIAVYTVVIMRLYDEDGKIPDDAQKIARRCNMRKPACQKALDQLVSDGKLQRSEQHLTHERVTKEIVKRNETSLKQSRNAQQREHVESKKPNENNEDPSDWHSQTDAKDMPPIFQKPDTRSHIDKKVLRKSKPTYTEDYDLFWRAWQGSPAKWPTHVKGEAYSHWKALSSEDREMAVASIKPYQDACKKADHDPKHAVRYLRDRAFEGFEPQTINTTSAVKVGTPEHADLAAWKRKKGLPVFDLMPIPPDYTPPMEKTP